MVLSRIKQNPQRGQSLPNKYLACELELEECICLALFQFALSFWLRFRYFEVFGPTHLLDHMIGFNWLANITLYSTTIEMCGWFALTAMTIKYYVGFLRNLCTYHTGSLSTHKAVYLHGWWWLARVVLIGGGWWLLYIKQGRPSHPGNTPPSLLPLQILRKPPNPGPKIWTCDCGNFIVCLHCFSVWTLIWCWHDT